MKGRQSHRATVRAVRARPSLSLVSFYRALQVVWVAEVVEFALQRVEVLGVLGAQGEGRAGDGGGQAKTFYDFLLTMVRTAR